MAQPTLPRDPEVRRVCIASWIGGWTYGPTKNGHWRLDPPKNWPEHLGGQEPYFLPGTPSDWRALKNCESDLRRRGVTFSRLPKIKAKQPQGDRKSQEPKLPKGFDAQRFAAALRDYRGRQGLNQQELGQRLGLQQTVISTLERGIRQPSIEMLTKIQSALEWQDYYGNQAPVIETVVAEPDEVQAPLPEPEEAPQMPLPEQDEAHPLSILRELPRLPDPEEGYPKAMTGLSEMLRQLTELRRKYSEVMVEVRELREENAQLRNARKRRKVAAVA